ncbi:MAG: hypothetical protein FWE05_09345 [Defluviitaleaceae bacterium]|nr:hypothetical protein [Defluviitaleaceae bacterium]
MIIIDTVTVAVETESELRSILSGTNTYTTIYLVNDMTLTQGVSIATDKTNLVIDGTYPLDGTGTVQTYTDMNSSSSNDTINVSNSNMPVITLQNMNIIGRNYYGIIYVPDGISGVTLNYINVTYTGPQFIYNAYGYNNLTDCTFTSAASTACPLNEMAEVSYLTIGGNTMINHQANNGSNATFWFRSGSNPTFIINENANVTITTTSYCFYTDLHPNITIGDGASLFFQPVLGMFLNNGHYINSLTIGDNASLTIIPDESATAAYSSPIVVDGNISVGNNANVFIQSTLTAFSPIYFLATAILSITNPQSFVLYSNKAQAINANGYPLTFTISAEQMNLWVYANTLNPGDINDIPDFQWDRYNNPIATDYTPLSIAGTCTSNVWSITSNNFTTQEISNLPALTNFHPETDQVLSLGKLLTVNPIVDGQYPISGTTIANAAIQVQYDSGGTSYEDTASADSSGNFSIVPSATIEIDTTVTITAHSPFLTGTIVNAAIDGGEISLETPDSDLPFVMVKLVVPNKLLYGRDVIWQQVIVHDTRVYPTPWEISATLYSDMTSQDNPLHTLPDALIYVDENDHIDTLGSDPVIVFTNDGTSSGDTIITWNDTQGILLNGENITFFANEVYAANINWQLDVE